MIIHFEEQRYGLESRERGASETWAMQEGPTGDGVDDIGEEDATCPGQAVRLRLMHQLLHRHEEQQI